MKKAQQTLYKKSALNHNLPGENARCPACEFLRTALKMMADEYKPEYRRLLDEAQAAHLRDAGIELRGDDTMRCPGYDTLLAAWFAMPNITNLKALQAHAETCPTCAEIVRKDFTQSAPVPEIEEEEVDV